MGQGASRANGEAGRCAVCGRWSDSGVLEESEVYGLLYYYHFL